MGVGRWTLGVVLIVLVAVIWSGSSVLAQYVFRDQGFNKPFAFTVICTSWFAVYLPLSFVASVVMPSWAPCPPWRATRPQCCNTDHGGNSGGSEQVQGARQEAALRQGPVPLQHLDHGPSTPSCCAAASHQRGQQQHEHEHQQQKRKAPVLALEGDQQRSQLPLSDFTTIVHVSLIMCPLWFLANYAYNQGLAMTSVTSSTVIASTSAMFTFLFSVIARIETFRWHHLVGVATAVAGGVLVGVSDGRHSTDGHANTVSGDLVCIASACGYGLYTVTLRYLCQNRNVPMPWMFGFLGLFSMALLVPPLLMASSYTDVAKGLSAEVFGWISLKALFDNVLSDYLWAEAVLLTSPTVATIGLSLTIPLGFLSDALIHHIYPTAMSACGGVLVVVAFVTLNLKEPPRCGRKEAALYQPLATS